VPHPRTLESIARAFKIPTERVYRIARLLLEIPEPESFIEEVTHHIRQIQSPYLRRGRWTRS